MNQAILTSCTPWVICLVVAVVAARVLLAISGAKLDFSRLSKVHTNESGSVQSLSFVLTLPFFVMVLMLIVQVNQIMFGNILVHYSAFAAVRSASVWIPANRDPVFETANRISSFELEPHPEGQLGRIVPTLDGKFSEIRQAATLACMPLAPSRYIGYTLDPYSTRSHIAMEKVYSGLDPNSSINSRISDRLKNKLAYSYPNTEVELTFLHRRRPRIVWIGDERVEWRDPLLGGLPYEVPPYPDEYYPNELGWQDELTALVTFNLPLLPGPIRFFAPTGGAIAADGTTPSRDQTGEVFIWPLKAFATMGMEGQKPQLPYWQETSQ
ncbi:pilus assembly protein [Mariniblastus sp.]|nr:pilus assembly protein [Mariniblastus sp.]